MLLALGIGSIAFGLAGGGLVALAVYTWWRSRLGPSPPGAECLRATCADVARGGAIRLGSFGDDGEDVELTIARRVRVRLAGEEWLELSGEYRGRTLALEWGARRVVAYRRTRVPLEAIGLAPALLDAAKPGSPPLELLESTFRVEETGDAIREGDRPEDSLATRTWGLAEDGKARFIRIERTGDQPPVASEGVIIARDAVEIVRLGPDRAASKP